MTSIVSAPLNTEQRVAIRRINAFRQRFGDGHFYLACHAALPLALTPNLLYCLWVNFQQDSHQELLDIPWIAVSDLILSNLCEEVGYELYEMDVTIRNELLKQLQNDSRFGLERIYKLADFLITYVEQELDNFSLDTHEFAKAQKWTALAYKNSATAVCEITLALTQLKLTDKTEWIRMSGLVKILEQPLAEFPSLLIYADAMANYMRGDLQTATSKFRTIMKNNTIQIAQVNLPVPEAIKKGLSLTITFDAVTIDAQGNKAWKEQRQTEYFSEDLGYGDSLEMIAIPGGTFIMGSPSTELGRAGNEGPQRFVTINPLFFGKYEVTQRQWNAVVTLPKVKRTLNSFPSTFQRDNRPVVEVSWEDAIEFCARLSHKAEREFRLPSEAEWEYACRAGTSTPFHFGETITVNLANYDGNYTYGSAPKGVFRQHATDVGSFLPNAFGLYDMHGNVWEWCLDYWHENYREAPLDASPWIVGGDSNRRLMRGGSSHSQPKYCRSACRHSNSPSVRSSAIGFRVVSLYA